MPEIVGQGVVEYDADTRKHDAALAASAAKAKKAGEAAASGFAAKFEQAGKSIQQSSLISQMETIGSLGIQVGGNISRLSSIFTSLVRPVAIAAQVLGPIPLAIGAVAIATVGLGVAIAGMPERLAAMGTAAGEAGERLAKLGLLEQEHIEFVRDMTDATTAAGAAQDRMRVTMSANIGIIEQYRLGVTGARASLADLVSVGEGTGRGGQIIATMLVPPIGLLAERGREAVQEIRDLESAMKALNDVSRKSERAVRANNDAIREAAAVEREIAQLKKDDLAYEKYLEGERKRIADEAARRAEESAAAERRRSDMLIANERELDSEREAKAKRELARRQAAAALANKESFANHQLAQSYQAIADGASDASLVANAAIAKLTSEMQDYIGSWAQFSDIIKQFFGSDEVQLAMQFGQQVTQSIADATSGIFELTQQGVADAQTAQESLVKANARTNRQMQSANSATERARLSALLTFGRASKEAADAAYDARKKEALKAFAADKAGKIASIAMSTAAGIMQAYAQLGPIAGTVAGIGVTAAGVIQAAVVAKQKPPTFHTGGVAPDEMGITTKRGEVVVSQRDYGRLLDTLDRLDRRMGVAPGVEASVVVQIDGKDIPGRSTVRTGRRNPYTAGVV